MQCHTSKGIKIDSDKQIWCLKMQIEARKQPDMMVAQSDTVEEREEA